MAPMLTKRGRGEGEERRPKKKMRIKKQIEYHSSSEDEDQPTPATQSNSVPLKPRAIPKPILKQRVPPSQQEPDAPGSEPEEDDGIDEVEKNTALNAVVDRESEEDEGEDENGEIIDAASASASEDDEDEDASSESETSTTTSSTTARARKKRNDPTAFATSITKILSTKLTTTKRSDPVLSRSKSASDAHKAVSDAKLESKARAQIRAEKKAALEKGRVKDVLALEAADVDTGGLLEEERRLRKMAQRGVVRLFNAVRAAQVRSEEGMRAVRAEGVVGMGKREERVVEMSKQGFLDLLSSAGK